LRVIAAALPADFPAPVCVVLHTAPQAPGLLHEILSRCGAARAVTVHKKERLRNGTIYVAAPDCHLIVEPGHVRATKGPRENRFRPAIDPLFRSAAQVYGPNAIGVVLTGNLDDGTAGLATIKQLGGLAVVQDPHDALYPSMPESALSHVAVDHTVVLDQLVPLLMRLTSAAAQDGGFTVPERVNVEVNIAKEHHPGDAGLEAIGTPSPFACPECHGVLLQLEDGDRVRFRCHTGHAYSVDSLVAGVDEGIQHAMWNAIRALEEAALLMQRISALHPGDPRTTDLNARVQELRHQQDALRAIASGRDALTRG
jgi:two-component system chemotaxis response regulator CheB